MQIENYLQKIGLTPKEARLYITGLQLGPASILDLAKESGLKRTTIYELINSLKNKKLVNQSKKDRRNVFIMEEPDNLTLFLKQQEKVLERIIPDLEALKNISNKKPTIRVFENQAGLEKIYEDMIKKDGEILAFAAPRDVIAPSLLEYLREDWKPRRVKNNIEMKRLNINLSQDSKLDYKIIPDPEDLQLVRYLPVKNYPFSIGIYIYRSKVAFVSYNPKEMIGIIIKSPEIVLTMKMVFNLFWKLEN